MFIVPTDRFNLLHALLTLRLAKHLLVLMNITTSPTANRVARLVTGALPCDDPPRHLMHDRGGGCAYLGPGPHAWLATIHQHAVIPSA